MSLFVFGFFGCFGLRFWFGLRSEGENGLGHLEGFFDVVLWVRGHGLWAPGVDGSFEYFFGEVFGGVGGGVVFLGHSFVGWADGAFVGLVAGETGGGGDEFGAGVVGGESSHAGVILEDGDFFSF